MSFFATIEASAAPVATAAAAATSTPAAAAAAAPTFLLLLANLPARPASDGDAEALLLKESFFVSGELPLLLAVLAIEHLPTF